MDKEHGLLIPLTAIELCRLDDSSLVYIYQDTRGESESFEAYSLIGFNSAGRRQWVEGIRKDRSAMREPYRAAIDKFLSSP